MEFGGVGFVCATYNNYPNLVCAIMWSYVVQ